ncbi:hypothetical protein ACE6H2_005210 [Prunus campanulata]
MASALETLCGQAFGAKRYHMLGTYMQRSWIVLFFCCILPLPVYIFASPILKLMGQPDDVAEQSGVVALWLIPLQFSYAYAFQFPLQRFLQSQIKNLHDYKWVGAHDSLGLLGWNRGIWGGMIFGGTAVQTVILAIVLIRHDWEKEAQKASQRAKKWSTPNPDNQIEEHK